MSAKRKSKPKKTAAAPRATASAPPARRASAWDRFWFAARDRRLCDVIRIGYALLLLVNLATWAPNLERWFGHSGVLPADVARHVAGVPSLVAYLPVTICYGLLVAHTVALLVGWYPRIQALAILLWLAQFANRNVTIADGEDIVFRLFAFYLALVPSDREAPPWPLRLVQIQVAVIYFSSAIEKSLGHDWTNGHALYYVARLDDWFGKLPAPSFVFDSPIVTYGVLATEWLLPLALFHPRTRRYAIGFGIAFHLSIEWTMNLFLFHWIMILGLLSFLERDDLVWLRDKYRQVARRSRRDPDPAG